MQVVSYIKFDMNTFNVRMIFEARFTCKLFNDSIIFYSKHTTPSSSSISASFLFFSSSADTCSADFSSVMVTSSSS